MPQLCALRDKTISPCSIIATVRKGNLPLCAEHGRQYKRAKGQHAPLDDPIFDGADLDRYFYAPSDDDW